MKNIKNMIIKITEKVKIILPKYKNRVKKILNLLAQDASKWWFEFSWDLRSTAGKVKMLEKRKKVEAIKVQQIKRKEIEEKKNKQKTNVICILSVIMITNDVWGKKNIMYFEFFPGFQNVEYFKIFVMFIFILIISILLFVLAYIFSLSTIKDSEKLSQYECGFEPFDEATRQPFDVHFYVVGILFLIFDVEIALLFPWVLALKTTGWLSFITMLIFLVILTIGFYYEWHRGALLWPKDQMYSTEQNKITKRFDDNNFGGSDL